VQGCARAGGWLCRGSENGTEAGGEAWNRGFEEADHLSERDRRSRERGSLAAEQLEDQDLIGDKELAQELVRPDDLDTEVLKRARAKVGQVLRDDEVSTSRDGCGRNMVVAGIAIHHRLNASDLVRVSHRVRERLVHQRDEASRLYRSGAPVPDEVAFDLIEDPSAPDDFEELGLGAAQQRVPQRRRIEHAGVEDRGDGHFELAVAALEFFGVACQLVELASALGRTKVAVGQDVASSKAAMRSDHVVRELTRVDQLDDVRPRDPEEVSGLLRGEQAFVIDDGDLSASGHSVQDACDLGPGGRGQRDAVPVVEDEVPAASAQPIA
jgi:hypothetical protein